MAGSGARHLRSAGKNPFFDDEDDVDDETFLRNAPNKPISNSASSTFGRGGNGSQWQEGPATTEEDRRHQLLLERQKIEERTLQATGRSKGILEETEKVGISTAEVSLSNLCVTWNGHKFVRGCRSSLDSENNWRELAVDLMRWTIPSDPLKSTFRT